MMRFCSARFLVLFMVVAAFWSWTVQSCEESGHCVKCDISELVSVCSDGASINCDAATNA